MRRLIAGFLIAVTVLVSVLVLIEYRTASAVFSRSKWEYATPNERLAILDSALSLLEVGMKRSKVRSMLGTPDVAEADRYEYRITDSPFAQSEMLVLTFDSSNCLTDFYIEEAAG